MATSPNDPKADDRKRIVSAIIWTLLAAGVAVALFIQAARPENEKKNFHILAGTFAIVAAAVNGYAAWKLLQKTRTPPST